MKRTGRYLYNAWILKPGENTNRGRGIAVYDDIEDIRNAIFSDYTAKHHTVII